MAKKIMSAVKKKAVAAKSKKSSPAKKAAVKTKKSVAAKSSKKAVAAKTVKSTKATKATKASKATKAAAPVKSKRKVEAIPKGYHSITPYLIVNNASKAIEFYKKALGAKEMIRMDKPGGKVGHAELKVGDSRVMIADEAPEMGSLSPKSGGSCAIGLHFYTKNVDAIVKAAVSAGAKLLMPVQDMFYGDRSGSFEDPYGHKWHVSTHIEDVSKATLIKRTKEQYEKKA